jgi:hypothetical protein
MDKELKATIFALLNEFEEVMDGCAVDDEDVTRENLAFVREGLEYL